MQDSVETANDDGADPSTELKAQNANSAQTAEDVAEDDPHKAEKLAKLGQGDGEAEATE